MTQISTYIERIEIVFEESASIKVIQVNEAMKIDGVVRQITPVAASSVTDPKVKAILEASSQAVTAERDALQTSLTKMTVDRDAQKLLADAVPGLQAQLETLIAEKQALQAEVERLTALVPPPVPDAFLSADWPRFRNLILSEEAVQRVATGNPTAWPLMVLYLAQLSSTPSRGADIAQLWTMLEQNTPITPDEVARINAIATECGVPLQMHDDGSIG